MCNCCKSRLTYGVMIKTKIRRINYLGYHRIHFILLTLCTIFSGKKERDVNPLYETVDPGKLCEGRLFPIESEDDCDKAHLFLKEKNAFYKDVESDDGYYIFSGSNDKQSTRRRGRES